jgi:hypothetical protein
VSGAYERELDAERGVVLYVEFTTSQRQVVDHAVILAVEHEGRRRTVRIYDGSHSVNEMTGREDVRERSTAPGHPHLLASRSEVQVGAEVALQLADADLAHVVTLSPCGYITLAPAPPRARRPPASAR